MKYEIRNKGVEEQHRNVPMFKVMNIKDRRSLRVKHTHFWLQGVNMPIIRSHYHQTSEGIHSSTALYSVARLKCPLRFSRGGTQEIHTAIVATWGNSKIIPEGDTVQ